MEENSSFTFSKIQKIIKKTKMKETINTKLGSI